jgi:hypothetical protein
LEPARAHRLGARFPIGMTIQSAERSGCDPCRHHEHGGAEAVGRDDPQRLARQAIGAGDGHENQQASPTAAPTEVLVEAMPEATPCSSSATPVLAAMKMAVKTTPSPILSTRKGPVARFAIRYGT